MKPKPKLSVSCFLPNRSGASFWKPKLLETEETEPMCRLKPIAQADGEDNARRTVCVWTTKSIAAQLLAHIPTFKRGEVLLVQKIGIVSPAALVSSTSKGTYDAIFAGNLTPSHVAALDELFPATNNRASRRAFFSIGGVGSRS